MKNYIAFFWLVILVTTGTLLAIFINTSLGIEHPAFFMVYGSGFTVVLQLVNIKMGDSE